MNRRMSIRRSAGLFISALLLLSIFTVALDIGTEDVKAGQVSGTFDNAYVLQGYIMDYGTSNYIADNGVYVLIILDANEDGVFENSTEGYDTAGLGGRTPITYFDGFGYYSISFQVGEPGWGPGETGGADPHPCHYVVWLNGESQNLGTGNAADWYATNETGSYQYYGDQLWDQSDTTAGDGQGFGECVFELDGTDKSVELTELDSGGTAPDITVAKSADVSTADPGDLITYTIYFDNVGGGNADTVWINDTLPAGVTYVSHTANLLPEFVSFVQIGNVLYYEFTSVAPGSHSFTITVQVNAGIADGEILTNYVCLNYTDTSQNIMPESCDSAAVTVTAPVITVEKAADKTTVAPDETLVYTIYFNNTGSGVANTVWINDTLPAEVSYVSDTAGVEPSFASSDVSGNPLRYVFTNVAPGTHSFTITVQVNIGTPPGTILTNCADLDYTDANDNPLPSSSDCVDVEVTALPVHNIDTDEYFNEIQTAIDDPDTLNGHTIEVAAGTYNENVVIDKNLTLIGEGRDNTIIDGGGNGNAVNITVGRVNITGFNVTGGSGYAGIKLLIVENCYIDDITATGSDIGISLFDRSDSNTIANNTVSNNKYGIRFYGSSGNTIVNNTISSNSEYGIHASVLFFYASRNNVIYHNNIISNANQAYNDNTNLWNATYPTGGNYWSDYSGTDTKSGPNQDLPGSDGIGDTAYTNIGGGTGAQDNYPLMEPYDLIPDLSISSDDITLPSGDIYVWDIIEINATVRNIGHVDATCTVSFYLDTVSTENLLYREYEVLVPAHGSTDVTTEYLANLTGTHTIIVNITDSNPAEENLANNQASKGITINEEVEPILRVHAASDKLHYTDGVDPSAEIIVRTTYHGDVVDGCVVTATVKDPIDSSQPIVLTEASPGIHIGTYSFGASPPAGEYKISATAQKTGYVGNTNIENRDTFILIDPVGTEPSVTGVLAEPKIVNIGTQEILTVDVSNYQNVQSIYARARRHCRTPILDIPLFDDGTHGDAAANDGTFSFSLDTADFNELFVIDIFINSPREEDKISSFFVKDAEENVTLDIYNDLATTDKNLVVNPITTNITLNITTAVEISEANINVLEHGSLSSSMYTEIVPSSNLETSVIELNITMSYNESALPQGADENDLRLYVYNSYTLEWEICDDSHVNPVDDVVWGKTQHFSHYNLWIDTKSPEHSNENPPIDGTTEDPTPTISVDVTDRSDIDEASIVLYVNGNPMSHTTTRIPRKGYTVSYTPLTDFSQGEVVTVRIVADDTLGNTLDFTWQFTVNMSAPPESPTNQKIYQRGNDIELTWDASTSLDIDYYNIYRSTTRDGFDFLTPYDSTGDTTYTDFGFGDGEWNNYFYVIRAVDKIGNEDGNEVKLGKYVNFLDTGWRLVSIPLEQYITTIPTVLSTIDGSYDSLQWYDPLDGNDPWKTYSPSKPSHMNDLSDINHEMGLWILMTNADNLVTVGRVGVSTNIPFYTGWNLVGYPTFVSETVGNAMSGLGVNYIVKDYDAGSPHRLKNLPDADMMYPGQGYWIWVDSDCVWTVNW